VATTLPKTSVIASGEGATVELPKRLAAALKPGTPLRLAGFGNEGFAAVRETAVQDGFFCGTLDAFSIADVFGQVVSLARTGRLILVHDALRRTVSFRDGQVIFATSTDPRERLGRSLVRSGALTQEQLDEILPQVKPGVKLGQALMSAMLLTPAELYSAMTGLVREIVLASLEHPEGIFLFVDGHPLAEDELKLPERTRELLLAGIKRAEETSRLRRKFPPTLRLRLGTAPLKGGEPEVLEKLRSGADVATLRGVFQGTEHELLTWLDPAVAAKAVVPEKAASPVPTTPASAVSALDVYAQLIRAVSQALKTAGSNLSALRSFFEDPLPGMEQACRGVTLSEDGTLDLATLWKNCDADKKPLGKLKAYEAIDSFVSYALFSAKNQIPPELAEELARKFRELHAEHGG